MWEWTCSEYQAPYAGKEQQCADAGYFVLRGGAWYFGATGARLASRYNDDPTDRFYVYGFRPARIK